VVTAASVFSANVQYPTGANPGVPTLSFTRILQGRNNKVTLTWVPSGAAATSFTIQMATNVGFTTGVQTFANIPGGTTSFSVTVPRGTPGTSTYYFHIQAFKGTTGSGYSAPPTTVVTV